MEPDVVLELGDECLACHMRADEASSVDVTPTWKAYFSTLTDAEVVDAIPF
jgi:hypothetical protein